MKLTPVNTIRMAWLALLSALAIAGCSKQESGSEAGHEDEHVDGHRDEHGAAELAKGPHGGRLLEADGLSVEVTIFERGVPPEFRMFVYAAGKPIKPSSVKLSVELARFGGRIDHIEFAPKDDYLLGTAEVEEPHSFDVKIHGEYAGKVHHWNYESYEGRTTISAEMAQGAGVTIATAGSGKLNERLTLHGAIKADPTRQRSVTARYAGVIQSVAKQVGDSVRAGETLAMVESNESLQSYSVKAPIAGMIISRHANAGETAGNEPLFEIADYASVRAELGVFPGDFARLKKGQAVAIRSADGKISGHGKLTYLATAGNADNQSLVAQVLLDNKKGEWTPGLFVSADVVVSEATVALAVPMTALQKFRDWNVVFLNDGETYQAQPLELGRSDGDTIEVLKGIAAGDRYVATNSYLIKADIEKSGASHDH